MPYPLVYEINTRCWLRELSQSLERPLTLDEVPESELTEWQRLGFTHIWLMGIWATGPLARSKALAEAQANRAFERTLPDWRPEDVAGSPYAIAEYRVSPTLGGEPALRTFRQRLNARGLKLVVDFVANHLGLDHAWVREHPEYFVQPSQPAVEAFLQETSAAPKWLAHGKDPNFPAWTDTAQLDYRRPATRAAVLQTLHSVANCCDGLRCDMAMLLLNNVFARTWSQFPISEPSSQSEFWGEAIASVKKVRPDFLFLAEAYWGLEPRLQELGFDYTYDKELYDRLVARDGARVQQHLLAMPAEALAASAHFLENHDEARIASLLPLDEHRAAAVLLLGLPGLCLLHEGQLWGAHDRVPVQLLRRPNEPKQIDIQMMYDRLLSALPMTAIGRGGAKLLQPLAPGSQHRKIQNVVLVQWQGQSAQFDLVAVNPSADSVHCSAALNLSNLAEHDWQIRDLLSSDCRVCSGEKLRREGLALHLPGWGAGLFHGEAQT